MRRFGLIAVLMASVAAFAAADAPSEAELVGITYFAPVCPFYYRMMGPDGALREFQFVDGRNFKGPKGWSAEVVGNRISVAGPRKRRYTFLNGRLESFHDGKTLRKITYPVEPVYGGKPASLWGIEPDQMNQEKMQAQLDRLTDIWSMTGRFALWFRSPNAAAALLAILALVGMSLFLAGGWVRLVSGLAVLLPSLAGLALTSSRGGILAFLAGACILAFFAWRGRARCPFWWRRLAVLALCLVLAAVFAVVTQGTGRFTRDLAKSIRGRGEGRDRSALFCAGARMMADAPDGWGRGQAGPAYSHWYQSMGGDTWQMTLVSDQLTHLVERNWVGRWTWIFGWIAVLALLWKFALRGFGAWGVAVWISLLVASMLNVMLYQKELWVVPLAALGLFAWRLARGEWRAWRGYLVWLGLGLAASVVLTGALYAACAWIRPAEPNIRHDGERIVVGTGSPRVWIVDDGEVLGGIYTQNLIRRHYLGTGESAAIPASVYCRRLSAVPEKVERLVLAGRQGGTYLDLLKRGKAPQAREVVFLSPPFGPSSVPDMLLARSLVAMLLGEFAARYVDVYGEGPYPAWVTVVKGAELFIPNWTGYVIGGRR